MRRAAAVAAALALTGCAGNVQLDRSFALYEKGYLDAKLEGVAKACTAKAVKTPLETDLCSQATLLEKLLGDIATMVTANDNAQKALEGRLMQLGVKALGGGL